jgi:aminoglycoside phosphotransferase (APT) family kinase protein
MPPEPPRSTLRWVLEQARADSIVAVDRLTGGWTSAMHAVTVRCGPTEYELVLRRMFREPWKTHAVGLLEREAGILRFLAPHPVPTAEFVAVDATAEMTDEPALLMRRLPGRLRLDASDRAEVVDELARMLTAIHAVRPPRHQRPRAYQSWAVPERRVIPEWATQPELWTRAFSLIEREPPAFRGCFLHRDFHPGNVLFDHSSISGVVDWVETSWGPSDLDVAHCCTGLAVLHGTDAVEQLIDAYRAAGGELADDPNERAYWQLIDAVGFLPDPAKIARPWRESGRPDLTAERARTRLEAHVGWILERAWRGL